VFDYIMPADVRLRYPLPVDVKEYGVLNVHRTGNPEDWINGIVTEVSWIDMPALRDREPGYDLIPVVCMAHPTSASPPISAYILACPPGSPNTDSSLLPHPGYLAMCLAGVRDVSEEFAELFLDTTYLADQVTRLRSWFSDSNADERIRSRLPSDRMGRTD